MGCEAWRIVCSAMYAAGWVGWCEMEGEVHASRGIARLLARPPCLFVNVKKQASRGSHASPFYSFWTSCRAGFGLSFIHLVFPYSILCKASPKRPHQRGCWGVVCTSPVFSYYYCHIFFLSPCLPSSFFLPWHAHTAYRDHEHGLHQGKPCAPYG